MKNLTYDDFEVNGRYCKTGLAFPVSNNAGNCTGVQRIEFNNMTIVDPYPCNPMNQSRKCHLVYNASEPNDAIPAVEQSFNVPCGCALDGNDGYCSKILGTPFYITAMENLKKVLEYSNCHTLDRHNMRAQGDTCGIGPGNDIDSAIESLFDIHYWPMIKNQRVRACIESFFDDSPTNLAKSKAIILEIGVLFLMIMIITVE